MKRFAYAVISIFSCCLIAYSAQANQSLLYTKTVIAIVPGSTIPKAIEASPAVVSGKPDEKVPAPEEMADDAPAQDRHTLEVQVRSQQIPANQGMYTTYPLDDKHGVLTYFSAAEPRVLATENIHQKIDILFIRDDGVIAQIVPEVVLAYLSSDMVVDFPVRAYLYVTAGLTQGLGIEPGDRIEHGMFTPRPTIKRVENPNE